MFWTSDKLIDVVITSDVIEKEKIQDVKIKVMIINQ